MSTIIEEELQGYMQAMSGRLSALLPVSGFESVGGPMLKNYAPLGKVKELRRGDGLLNEGSKPMGPLLFIFEPTAEMRNKLSTGDALDARKVEALDAAFREAGLLEKGKTLFHKTQGAEKGTKPALRLLLRVEDMPGNTLEEKYKKLDALGAKGTGALLEKSIGKILKDAPKSPELKKDGAPAKADNLDEEIRQAEERLDKLRKLKKLKQEAEELEKELKGKPEQTSVSRDMDIEKIAKSMPKQPTEQEWGGNPDRLPPTSLPRGRADPGSRMV